MFELAVAGGIGAVAVVVAGDRLERHCCTLPKGMVVAGAVRPVDSVHMSLREFPAVDYIQSLSCLHTLVMLDVAVDSPVEEVGDKLGT